MGSGQVPGVKHTFQRAAQESILGILVLGRLHDPQTAVRKLHEQGLLHAGSHELRLVSALIEAEHQLSEVWVEQQAP